MLGWIKGLFSSGSGGSSLARRSPAMPRRVPIVRARYDAAQTTDDNRRHWANADANSANSANAPGVRRLLRARSRYEVANNSYARGIVNTLANDTIGTGPRLQMQTDNPALNAAIEAGFGQWADAVGLTEKLRIMRMARATDGELFGILGTNPAIDSPVSLDVRLVEAEQVAAPYNANGQVSAVLNDGIKHDMHGNPISYSVLRSHPGDTLSVASIEPPIDVPASAMIHYFQATRPGQSRGIPEITPALPLFAQLRRFTLAVIAAAETAADFAAVLYTDSPADGESDDVVPLDTVDLEKRMATTLPAGWKLGQITAEQPATTYAEFKHEILNEIARCLSMPFNVAAGNSSGYNYASGRLDHQVYYKSIRVDQDTLGRVVLDRILNAWIAEAILVSDLLPLAARSIPFRELTHAWFWDGVDHVDPVKEATAQAQRLVNNTTTLAAEYARAGKDWEAELRQVARERALMLELGITPAGAAPAAPADNTDNADPVDNEKENADA